MSHSGSEEARQQVEGCWRAAQGVKERPVVDHFSSWHPRLALPLVDAQGFDFCDGAKSPRWASGDYPTFMVALGYAARKKLQRICRRERKSPVEFLSLAIHRAIEQAGRDA